MRKPKDSGGADGRLELESFVPYRLSVLQQEVSRSIAGIYARRFDLMRHDWRVMAVLGAGEPLSANGVAERTNMDKVQVSRAIARLKRKSLVAQQQDRDDKRKSSLRLTAKGRDIYREIVPLARAREAKLLSVLSATELQQLDRLMDKLYRQAHALLARDRQPPD